MAEDSRYTVEQGTDGSWLLIDRGSGHDQRQAFERMLDEHDARLEASALASLDALTAQLPVRDDPEWVEADAAVENYTATFDAHYNFNHLLRSPYES